MRILYLAPFAAGGPRGTTRWRVLPLARALADKGHAVRVLIPPYDCPRQSGSSWSDQGVSVENLALPPLCGSLGHLAMAQRLAQAVVAWQPDVVHCFKPKGSAGLATWLVDRLSSRRVPLIMDTDDWETGWNQEIGYPPAWRAFFRWQERWGLRRADAVTVASRWLERYATGLRSDVSPGVADSAGCRVYYLPNAVDPVVITPVVRDMELGPIVLAYTRFVEHTPEQLVRVWQQTLAQEPRGRLVVAGPKAGREIRGLVRAAAAAGISHSILMVGWVPSASRSGLFAAADVALLPVVDTPRNCAKSPMRLLDLLAAGVPVVTQNVGEYGCLVSDGVTGLVIEVGGEEALAAAVVRLLRDPLLRDRLGQAAATTMRLEYSWSRMVQRALMAYKEVEAAMRANGSQEADCRVPS